MATRIRLQRFGKKNQPFYHIVIADGRAPRDGRFIEKIGTYNTLTHPADIEINFDRALYWVECGASPSETVRSILKREGVYLMKHLKRGVVKGALSEMEAERKFNAWRDEKDSKLGNLKREANEKARLELKKRLEQELKVKEAIAQKIAAKYAKFAAKEAAEKAKNEETAELEDVISENTSVTEETIPEKEEVTPENAENVPEKEEISQQINETTEPQAE